jgi:peptidoglycan/LPS O-acetylase OafA/YrhL
MGALRLFLALVVVFDHARVFCFRPKQLDIPVFYALGFNAGYAVMFFYIISGFLISFVLRSKYEASRDGTVAFYKSRFTRIFSLYWPLAIITLLFVQAAQDRFLQSTLTDKFTSLFLFGIDWNLAFSHYPARDEAAAIWLLDQAWSLGAELTFYLLAPFILRSKSLTIGLLVLSSTIRAVTVAKFGFAEAWTYWFFPSTILFFMLGHLASITAERAKILKRPAVGVFLVAICVVSLMFPTYALWDSGRFWISIICFAFGLPGIFESSKDSKWLNRLGELSFPVYLVHLLAIHMLEKAGLFEGTFSVFGSSPTSVYLIMIAVIAMSIALAVITHRYIELTTARQLRGWLGQTLRPGTVESNDPPPPNDLAAAA